MPEAGKTLLEELTACVPGLIHWYPGHMAKAQKELQKKISQVDIVLEIVDARVPYNGRHLDLEKLAGRKDRVLVLTKADLAEAEAGEAWRQYYLRTGRQAFLVDAVSGTGIGRLGRYLRRPGLPARILVVGMPNTGKSTLINRLTGQRRARTGAAPGITRGLQWLQAERLNALLYDTPGVLQPKFLDVLQGLKLVWVGSIGPNAYDPAAAGMALAWYLKHTKPELLSARYGGAALAEGDTPAGLLTAIGRRRGFLAAGGQIDLELTGTAILKDFRRGSLGRVTLDNLAELQPQLQAEEAGEKRDNGEGAGRL
ncbi:MAG TPA: ribosome biogenesis GTPase YlqF [Firmicutes bacterium]|nr:ribosome biogenesis GTPase YlqF [Bacillota bacterium]